MLKTAAIVADRRRRRKKNEDEDSLKQQTSCWFQFSASDIYVKEICGIKFDHMIKLTN